MKFRLCFAAFIPSLCVVGSVVVLQFFTLGQKTCSCRSEFLSMGRNNESTLFFDGSNFKFEDSRG